MHHRSLHSKSGVLFVHMLILLSLVISGCGTATAPAATLPSGTEAVTEVVTDTPVTDTPTEVTTEQAELTFLYPASPDSTEGSLIMTAVNEFQSEHPNILVNLEFDPSDNYYTRLQTQAAAGNPPDLAKIHDAKLATLYTHLLPTEEMTEIDPDFLPDAINSTLFKDQHYGIPQRRDSCSLAYDYLAVFSGTQHPTEAFLLADYLTQKALQEAAFMQLQWYPTRASVYTTLGLECSQNEAIRFPRELLEDVIPQVTERASELDLFLDGNTVLPEGATAVFEDGKLVGFGAPVWEPISIEDAQNLLESTGLVIGVLFINDVEEYPNGNYVIKCFTDHCVLVDTNGNEIPYNLLISEELAVPVEVPRTALVPGSIIQCTWYLIWKRCTRVG